MAMAKLFRRRAILVSSYHNDGKLCIFEHISRVVNVSVYFFFQHNMYIRKGHFNVSVCFFSA